MSSTKRYFGFWIWALTIFYHLLFILVANVRLFYTILVSKMDYLFCTLKNTVTRSSNLLSRSFSSFSHHALGHYTAVRKFKLESDALFLITNITQLNKQISLYTLNINVKSREQQPWQPWFVFCIILNSYGIHEKEFKSIPVESERRNHVSNCRRILFKLILIAKRNRNSSH